LRNGAQDNAFQIPSLGSNFHACKIQDEVSPLL
jgi:hypothetical protein